MKEYRDLMELCRKQRSNDEDLDKLCRYIEYLDGEFSKLLAILSPKDLPILLPRKYGLKTYYFSYPDREECKEYRNPRKRLYNIKKELILDTIQNTIQKKQEKYGFLLRFKDNVGICECRGIQGCSVTRVYVDIYATQCGIPKKYIGVADLGDLFIISEYEYRIGIKHRYERYYFKDPMAIPRELRIPGLLLADINTYIRNLYVLEECFLCHRMRMYTKGYEWAEAFLGEMFPPTLDATVDAFSDLVAKFGRKILFDKKILAGIDYKSNRLETFTEKAIYCDENTNGYSETIYASHKNEKYCFELPSIVMKTVAIHAISKPDSAVTKGIMWAVLDRARVEDVADLISWFPVLAKPAAEAARYTYHRCRAAEALRLALRRTKGKGSRRAIEEAIEMLGC
jgi:hypothetical protein